MTITLDQFYDECAQILDATHNGEKFPYYKRTRWNNRVAGRGRFEGRGIVRCFGDQVHIALTNPRTHAIMSSKDEALEFLRQLSN